MVRHTSQRGTRGAAIQGNRLLGIGLFYELFHLLDFHQALSERVYWALATVATGLLIITVVLVLSGVG
jgi:hypothetical protein